MNTDTNVEEQLPQTPTVFTQPPIEFDHHDWQQEGDYAVDICLPHRFDCHNGGMKLPPKMHLIYKDGKYDLETLPSQ